jgi:hypothetical protein
MFKRRINSRWLIGLVLCCAWTVPGRADPVTVTGTATLQGDGSYLYQYTLTNSVPGYKTINSIPAPGPAWLTPEFTLQLIPGGFIPPVTNVSQTGGWALNAGWSLPGYYVWTHTGDIPANTTATFAFNSTAPPGDALYIVSTFSPEIYLKGHIVGPASTLAAPPVDVPEPASVVLFATAGGLLLVRRLRRKPAPPATP